MKKTTNVRVVKVQMAKVRLSNGKPCKSMRMSRQIATMTHSKIADEIALKTKIKIHQDHHKTIRKVDTLY